MGSIWDTILEAEPHSSVEQIGLEHIPNLKLSEFTKRDMAIQIFSEILDQEIWLCSNQGMVDQIRKDDPEAVCYGIEELRSLIRLNPSPEGLRRIHEAKATFPASTVVKAETKSELLDRALAELAKEFPPELYQWIDESGKEFSARISEAENKINEIFRSGSLEELRAALDEYKGLYREALKRMKK